MAQSAPRMERLEGDLDASKRGADNELATLLHATLHSIGDAVMTTDNDGVVQMMNPVASALTGYGEEEARGRPIEEVFRMLHETTRAVLENPIRQVLGKAGWWRTNHTVIVSKSGVNIPIDKSCAPISENNGPVNGGVLVFRDVSERKRAEETTRRLAAIIEGSEDAIVGETLDGTVTSWNRGAEVLFGYPAEEMIGASINRVIPADQAQESQALESIIQQQSSYRFDSFRLTKDKRRIAVSLAISPIRDADGRIMGASRSRAILLASVTLRKYSCRARRWKPSAGWRAGLPTTSTISSR